MKNLNKKVNKRRLKKFIKSGHLFGTVTENDFSLEWGEKLNLSAKLVFLNDKKNLQYK